MIYLDYASTTPIKPIALSAIKEASFANPNSLHGPGLEAAKLLVDSNNLVKDHINGHNGKLIWLNSASLANYFVISTNINNFPNSFICMKTAHKSILAHPSPHITLTPTREGLILFEELNSTLTGRTKLISILYVNNETGIIQPVDLLKHGLKNSLYHIDAVQAAGKLPIDVEHLECDYLTMSGHKFGTPKGIACLWVRDGVPIDIPYLGTPPVPLISAFAKTLTSINLPQAKEKRIKKELFFTERLKHYASLNFIEFDYNVPTAHKIAGILSIKFKGLDASELLMALSDKGIAVSTGSACNSREIIPSHVLIAMNVSPKDVLSTIRISFSHESKYEDLEKGIIILTNTIKEMLNNGSQPGEDN